MSRIGKQPINIPTGVTITQNGATLDFKGPKGELKLTLKPAISIEIAENIMHVKRNSDEKEARSLHGLSHTLISNCIIGVTKGFEKKLEINGVGYRANVQGKKLVLNLGYSHPVEYEIPEGITIEMDAEKKNILVIKGINKQAVGQTAANIREFRKPEPYKGKGIKYIDEVIIRKAGKTASKDK